MTCDAAASPRGAKQGPCAACTIANATNILHHSSAHYTRTHVGRLVHADIARSFVSSLPGMHRHTLVFVDDHSRFRSESHVGVQRSSIGWFSADSALYPSELNEIQSGVVAALAPDPSTPSPAPRPFSIYDNDDVALEGLQSTQPVATGVSFPGIPTNDDDPDARFRDFDSAETAPSRHFQRLLGGYILRSRGVIAASALLTCCATTDIPFQGKRTNCCFKAVLANALAAASRPPPPIHHRAPGNGHTTQNPPAGQPQTYQRLPAIAPMAAGH
eukprot:6208338-Pleurochrysis_carterae.AAC.1